MKQLTLLFLVKDGQVLLAMKKRGFGAGRWNGVGGKLDAGETVEQALVRECQEEINVTPISFEKRAEIVFDEQHKGVREFMHVHVFVGTKWEGEPKETEEMSPKWFHIADLPFSEMWPDDPFWLPQVLEGKYLNCNFVLDENDQITSHNIEEVTGESLLLA